jgi:hypothetical protein
LRNRLMSLLIIVKCRALKISQLKNKQKFRPDPGLKLMEQVRQVMRYHHYAYRTEKTYCDWILCYI